MSNEKQQVIVLESNDTQAFEQDCNRLVNDGYEIKSCSCGFVNDAQYDYCSSFSAIFALKEAAQ